MTRPPESIFTPPGDRSEGEAVAGTTQAPQARTTSRLRPAPVVVRLVAIVLLGAGLLALSQSLAWRGARFPGFFLMPNRVVQKFFALFFYS